jgi:hypothetical protein
VIALLDDSFDGVSAFTPFETDILSNIQPSETRKYAAEFTGRNHFVGIVITGTSNGQAIVLTAAVGFQWDASN